MRFVVFEDTTKVLQHYIGWKVVCDLLAGGFAGFCSVMLNNPIDVIKTNMQGLEAQKYGGFLGCGKHILVNEGPFGFYKGVGPRLARVILDVAITFSIFNSLKRLMIRFLAWKRYGDWKLFKFRQNNYAILILYKLINKS